ncbi:MAG: hypothetical protein LBN26_09270 [Christensenellaceae bacterium]|jgi:hypothetical protein|nr:hypothetical protein [Christensenellaceae bacterium]
MLDFFAKRVFLTVVLFIYLAIFAVTGCSQEDDRFRVNFSGDGMHLFIEQEEFVEMYRITLWRRRPEIAVDGDFIGITYSGVRKYEIYQYENLPIMLILPGHKWTDTEIIPPRYYLQSKIWSFPELSNDTISGVNVVSALNYRYLRKEYNTNRATIAEVLRIISEGEKFKNTGEEVYILLLSSDSISEFVSGHSIMKDSDKYFIQIAPGENYTSISKELLEEIIGGPLPE